MVFKTPLYSEEMQNVVTFGEKESRDFCARRAWGLNRLPFILFFWDEKIEKIHVRNTWRRLGGSCYG